MTMDEEWMVPISTIQLRGREPLLGLNASVQDFWRFALGDLRMNNARGYLAEFVVARALGLNDARRIEWDAYDVLWEGITIEVKSSAYLQSWEQRRLSDIRFSGLKGTRFNPRHGYDPAGRRFNAMVYVFCVQTSIEHSAYEQLDIRQWQFYVISRAKLATRGFASINLAGVKVLSGNTVDLSDLKAAVRQAAEGDERDDTEWWEA
jgi:hypothetical protein